MNYSQWPEALRSGLADFTDRLADFLPNLLGALALMLGGWLLARLLRGIIRRLARHFDRFLGSRLIERPMRKLGIETPASEVLGTIVFWAVLFVFITAATETLGLPVIATWIGGLAFYLPRLLVGLLIIFAGILAGNLAGDAVQRAATAANVAQAVLLGRIAQLAILVIAAVTAVEQLGIDTAFLTATITIVIGALIGGVALAFGLGARAHVGNLIAAHYLRQAYRTGQTVRVAGVEGRLEEIGQTAAIIATDAGRVRVPAGEFNHSVSTVMASES